MTHRSLKRLLGLSVLLVLLGATWADLQAQRPPKQRHVHTPACRKWVPPKTEWVTERVWKPGGVKRVWEPPVYRTVRDRRGNPIQILVRAGYYRTVRTEGHYETVRRKITRPGRWVYTCGFPPGGE